MLHNLNGILTNGSSSQLPLDFAKKKIPIRWRPNPIHPLEYWLFDPEMWRSVPYIAPRKCSKATILWSYDAFWWWLLNCFGFSWMYLSKVYLRNNLPHMCVFFFFCALIYSFCWSVWYFIINSFTKYCIEVRIGYRLLFKSFL